MGFAHFAVGIVVGLLAATIDNLMFAIIVAAAWGAYNAYRSYKAGTAPTSLRDVGDRARRYRDQM